MLTHSNTHRTSLLIAAFLLLNAGSAQSQEKVIDLILGPIPAAGSDTIRTLESLTRVRGEGGLCQDALYLMSHYGDRMELFKQENQKAMDNPMINDTWRYCSIFANGGGDSVIVGRNWDNQNVGSIIISYYRPPTGYASVSLCRAMELGFPLNLDLEDIKSTELGRKLLLTPFYAVDGVNERGLTVAVAGVRTSTHGPVSRRQPVFITFLVRLMLDRTKNVDEAISLAERFIPFDLDRNSLSVHFFVADASGKSVVLEFEQDQWHKIYGDNLWQVMTNKPVYNVSDADLRTACWRYRGMSEALEQSAGNVNWRTGMRILEGAKQAGTTWSVEYLPVTSEMYLCVYQDWGTVYHFVMP